LLDVAPPPRDFAAKLRDIYEVYKGGGVTEQEYELVKKKLLEE
jgi:hypothetical protein